MIDAPLSAALGLGFLLGLRHALDADHVAAVSTLVTQEASLVRACLRGTFWGAGHAAALLAAAVAVIAFKLTIAPEVTRGVQLAAAVMLILLGGSALRRSLSAWTLHRHRHDHGGRPHVHIHLHGPESPSHDHPHLLRGAGRPFLVGLVHGMAGSGSLMLLALAAVPSPVGALLYVLLVGVGSTVGMLGTAGVLGIAFVLTAGRWRVAHAMTESLTGLASLTVGAALVWTSGV
jgi:ABC-type nickel/cobalt efflux system permease component RcnA